ncbi:MAG: pyrroline-5-carboxylate reductase [Lachnospiraceae bacterium]|nr:pyrroline-5-carboxylate reductase [Lachnospiraceae bacterium]MBQ2320709.1 pyrroline-5-carboxylate reductase [Lachnospiraceae bacterium]
MRLGFIGAGNMAQAIIGGIIKNGLVDKAEIIASAATQKTIDKVKSEYGINVTLDNREVAKADILFLAVKPVYYQSVIEEIRDIKTEGQIIVTIAAGKSLEWVAEAYGDERKIIRTMPNTPALVGEGITAVCPNENISDEELSEVCKLLNSFGKAEVIKESMMDAVVAVSGSSPAYVFMFIEAMADAAVAEGMPRAQAYQFAAQSVLGSAKMVLDTGKHPGELKDMVCSPAGTTIEAVRTLEKTGFRSSVMECMKACADKSRSM